MLGSIVSGAIGISQDYLKGVTECNTDTRCHLETIGVPLMEIVLKT